MITLTWFPAANSIRLAGTPAGQRVQTGDRLIQDQQLGSLGDGQGQGQLSPLAPGQLPGPLAGIQAQPVDPVAGKTSVPARIQLGAQPQVVRHRRRRSNRIKTALCRSPEAKSIPVWQ
jgi:hypothetical protein